MIFKSILITGGAGFVGSNLAVKFKEAFPGVAVLALDNLHRRGSELTLPRLRRVGVEFVHGDVRSAEDLDALPAYDVLVDCAAEPSVQAGAASPRFVLNNNLGGTLQCFEAARARRAAVMFLSTSRVYPLSALNALPFEEGATRFRWTGGHETTGFSAEHGVAETFPLDGPRSFYGASKLAAEFVLQEYAYETGMPAIINRCGVLAGPWQMGKVDQGVVALWVARHYFQKPLQYIGFGGGGKQVRDVLHIDDLFDLVVLQMKSLDQWDGRVFNVGGGLQTSVSLVELTAACQAVVGRHIPIASNPETRAADVRIYASDARQVRRAFGWAPARNVEQIVRDIYQWLDAEREMVAPVFG
jgi:CDP-paratose 2-epimerase